MIYNDIEEMIGNTPILRISEAVHMIPNVELYAKLELANPFGSVKDRVAKEMLHAIKSEVIAQNKTIVEASSGNTAKALSILCSKYKIPFTVFTNRIKIAQVRDTLKLLDVKVVELPGSSECPDPSNPKDVHAVIKDLVNSHPQKYEFTDQLFNKNNPKAHANTGAEIHADLGDIDYFFADLGTCGTIRGVGEFLRGAQKSKPQIMGVITAEGGYVPGGRNENELFEVGFHDFAFYDGVVKATTEDSISGMLELLRQSGVPCGPTTGLIYRALQQWFRQNPVSQKTKVVFIACDRFETYVNYVFRFFPEFLENNRIENSISEDELQDIEVVKSSDLDSFKGLIIDFRVPFAFSMGHIPKSINIPQFVLEDLIKSGSPFPKSEEILLVCPIGIVSRKIALLCKQKGYSVKILSGGIKGYLDYGNKLKVDS